MKATKQDRLNHRLLLAVEALKEIAVKEIPATNDEEHEMLHDVIALAQGTLQKLKKLT